MLEPSTTTTAGELLIVVVGFEVNDSGAGTPLELGFEVWLMGVEAGLIMIAPPEEAKVMNCPFTVIADPGSKV